MRRVIVTALCAASFLFMLPEPAHAWFDWIDQLSGPGPFAGIDFQWRVVCVQDDMAATDSATPDENRLRSLESFGKGKALAGIFGAGCLNNSHANPESSLNLRVARLWSIDNHLQYASGVEAPKVNIWQVEPSYSTFVDDKKMVELTMGMGVSVLSGNGFDSMTRVYFRPVMLTLTPGGRLRRGGFNSVTRGMSLSTGVIYMPKGFDAKDFGAVPGTFHTDNELLLTASVSYDLSRF